MSLLIGRRARPAAAALVAVASAWAAAVPAAGGAAPDAKPGLTLAAQTEAVVPAQPGQPAAFDLTVVAANAPATAQLSVSIYPRLRSRTGFEQAVATGPSGKPIGGTGPIALSAAPVDAHVRGGVDLDVTVTPTEGASGSAVALGCNPAAGITCTGVYPVEVSMSHTGRTSTGGNTPARFTTFLTYASSQAPRPLRFAWVVPVAASVTTAGNATSPAHALVGPGKSADSDLEGVLGDIRASPTVPVTIEASPATLQALNTAGSTGKAAVADLAAMSTNQSVDEVPAQPFVPIDLNALAAGGSETTEIAGQMAEGAAVLTRLHVTTTPLATAGWVASGYDLNPKTDVGSGLTTGLAQIGVPKTVVPDVDLASSSSITNGTTWASTFDLPTGRATTVIAGASDGVLANEFSVGAGGPVLAASQLLADLAMVHFELPNGQTPRGLIAVPPQGWVPTTTFDKVLLGGLAADPVVEPVTLSQYFTGPASVPTAGVRHLKTTGPGSTLGGSLAKALSRARSRLTAFDSAVPDAPTVLEQLDQALLASEGASLSAGVKRNVAAAFTRVLSAQLRLVSFATGNSVTLTARTGWVPITVLSGAPYEVVGTLSVSSDRFKFPHGSSLGLRHLDHATNPVRIDVYAVELGDLPLHATLTSPAGGLVIAQGDITVRSTATSVVGIVLTVLALVVLLGWWAKTWRTARRRRAVVRAAHRPPS